MKPKLYIALFIMIFMSGISFGQYSIDSEIEEPSMQTLTVPVQQGGMYMPSIAEDGRFVRILIVFVQFNDDNWNSTWNNWPVGEAPSGWMGTNLIDQNVNQNSTNSNLTHYYTTMSLGHYKIIGDCYHVITPHSRDEYINMGFHRGHINREVLQQLNDSTNINFADYDNWDNSAGTFENIE